MADPQQNRAPHVYASDRRSFRLPQFPERKHSGRRIRRRGPDRRGDGFHDHYLTFRDDEASIRAVLAGLLREIETADPVTLSDDTVKFYRITTPEAMDGDLIETTLENLFDNPSISSAFDGGWKKRVKAALNRWEFRPLDHATALKI